jgi:hypothetical protein
MQGFIVEKLEGRYGEHDERYECSTVEEAEARWEDLSGESNGDATENVGPLASGLIDELRETHPETGAEIIAYRMAQVPA